MRPAGRVPAPTDGYALIWDATSGASGEWLAKEITAEHKTWTIVETDNATDPRGLTITNGAFDNTGAVEVQLQLPQDLRNTASVQFLEMDLTKLTIAGDPANTTDKFLKVLNGNNNKK